MAEAPMLVLGVIVAPHGVHGGMRVKTFCADPLELGAYGALSTRNGDRQFELKWVKPDKAGARIDAPAATLGLETANRPDKIGFVIMDSALAKRYSKWPDFVATAPGVAYAYFDDFRKTRPDLYFKADSIEALAGKLGMDPSTLKESLNAHNAGDIPAPLATPPFHALGPAKSYIVLTDGGLAVDTELRLLGHEDRPIPGLWAAGSAGQGGLMLKGHGHHIGWAFTSGRIAGRHAAASLGNNA
ncbi:MAG: FAD-binding protein [Alphaproteobacteria bacterium]|nr:FAD-binding protein [Alphaproteobacteria bacterium]